jgi:hypothetical protein
MLLRDIRVSHPSHSGGKGEYTPWGIFRPYIFGVVVRRFSAAFCFWGLPRKNKQNNVKTKQKKAAEKRRTPKKGKAATGAKEKNKKNKETKAVLHPRTP